MIYEDITHKIIGSAMSVHSVLGNGFQEVIYQRALAIEMQKQILNFDREMEMKIFYDNIDIGTRRVDFFVEEKIMVELKAIINLNDSNLNQCRNYLEAYNLPVGLLINFGSNSLQYKRIYNTKHPDAKSKTNKSIKTYIPNLSIKIKPLFLIQILKNLLLCIKRRSNA